jgi:ChpA-C
MRTWARWTAKAAMFTASFVAAGVGSAGLASAATAGGPQTSGNNSILGGNQVSVPISVPVNVCGNAIAVLGDAFAGCQGGASVSHGSGEGDGSPARTSGNESILGGNQVKAPVSVPVNVCGNAVNAPASCAGGAMVHTAAWSSRSDGPQTSGNESILGGNQIFLPVSVPVNVCGNAVAVLGGAFAACQGGAWTGAPMPSSDGSVHLLAHHTSAAPAVPAKNVLRQSALRGALAGLTRLPVVAGLPAQVTHVAGGTAAAKPAQATLLSASVPAAAPGMGSGSLFALAFGALLAGAATLIAAGRRLSVRKAGR